jgi:hypothetical protein
MRPLEGVIIVLVSITALTTPSVRGVAQTKPPLPDVNVIAPPLTPDVAPRVVPATGQNSYFGRNRVEEDMFAEKPCSEPRMSSSAGGKCLEGYHLGPGYGANQSAPDMTVE